MNVVTISPKYQVVIPLQVRCELKVKPGQKLSVFSYEGRIEMVPVKNIRKMRGFAKGIGSDIEREKD